jgi:hypothetical protein
MWGGGGGGCGVSLSANEYSCAHGAQINFGNLTPYLTCVYKLLYTYCKCRAGHRQRKKCATVDTDNQQPTPDNQHPSTATVDDSYIRQSTVITRQPTADDQQQETTLPPTNKTNARKTKSQQATGSKTNLEAGTSSVFSTHSSLSYNSCKVVFTDLKPTTTDRQCHYMSFIFHQT